MPLKLTSHIGKLDQDTINSPNLCDRFTGEDLKRIGDWCSDGYLRDKRSRAKWEQRLDAAMDLAMQIQKPKNFPWAGCSNVAFPLITLGAWQFHARAYSTIIDGPNIVHYRTSEEDSTGETKARADRIGDHMSWQVMEEDQSWEEQHDRLLIHLPVVGTAFIKTYYSGELQHNVSELVMARDLVINYWAKSVEQAKRKTHLFPLDRNTVWEKIEAGEFRDVREEAWYKSVPQPQASQQQIISDGRAGMQPTTPSDELTPFQFGEQHALCDLDGDGYAEPYIITFELNSHSIVRIMTGFERLEDIDRSISGGIRSIRRFECFTKYEFLPSPDGGLYGIGFGVLLGPLNESVNSLINQLIDAGSMSNAAGGFLSRGAKIRGGSYQFAPFGWNRVDASGDDLRKSIFPLPVREPSMVLYQLLVLLVNYTQRIAGTTDPMVGENPGQNQPAETTRIVVEMGQKIYSAIFKRVWRGMKSEFQKLYQLNTTYLPDDSLVFGANGKATRQDYLGDPSKIAPVANPNVTSDAARLQQDMALKQFSTSTPGYDQEAVERRVLRGMRVDGIDEVYPGPKSPRATPPGTDPRLSVAQMEQRTKQMELQMRQQEFVQSLMEERRLNSARILELHAQAAKEMEEAGGVKEGHRIAAFQAALGALKAHDDSMKSRIELMLKSMEMEQNGNGDTDTRGLGGMANAAPDEGLATVGSQSEGVLPAPVGAGDL